MIKLYDEWLNEDERDEKTHLDFQIDGNVEESPLFNYFTLLADAGEKSISLGDWVEEVTTIYDHEIPDFGEAVQELRQMYAEGKYLWHVGYFQRADGWKNLNPERTSPAVSAPGFLKVAFRPMTEEEITQRSHHILEYLKSGEVPPGHYISQLSNFLTESDRNTARGIISGDKYKV